LYQRRIIQQFTSLIIQTGSWGRGLSVDNSLWQEPSNEIRAQQWTGSYWLPWFT